MRNASIILILVICFSSCKKFLEQEPYNRIAVSDIYKDFEGARTTLVGCYDNLRSAEYYIRDYSLFADIAGGNIKHSRSNNPRLLNTYNFANDAFLNDYRGFYATAYETIYMANNILTNVDQAVDANQFQKNRMRADAYSIRALVHFDLVRMFAQPYNFTADASHAGIILKTANQSATTPLGTPATVKQVYDQVLLDLDSALSLYGRSVPIYPAGDVRTYFSADAVTALQARVHLYRNDWEKVISLATALIASNKYPLVTTANYVSSWSGKNISTESIFELAYGNRIGESLGDSYNPNTTGGHLAATNDILGLYAPGDVRGPASLYVTAARNNITYSFTRKYQGTRDTANNIKIFRSGELYLSRAEAYAEANNLVAALADLNIIRKRANPSSVNFVSSDKQVILNEILNERRRELAFEGHWFFDVARKKRNLVRNDCTASTCSFNFPNEKYAVPIPQIQ
jgi:hypothetical protein